MSSVLINSEDHWRVSEIRSNQFNSESVMERGGGAERLIESIINERKRVERYQGILCCWGFFYVAPWVSGQAAVTDAIISVQTSSAEWKTLENSKMCARWDKTVRLSGWMKTSPRNPFVSLGGRFKSSTCASFKPTKRPFDAGAVFKVSSRLCECAQEALRRFEKQKVPEI